MLTIGKLGTTRGRLEYYDSQVAAGVEELEVLWDYELDRRILEQEGWEDLASRGFDDPRFFAAFLNTLRWNSVTATDPNLFQSPFGAGIKIDSYQMEPLRKALRLPRVNLFIGITASACSSGTVRFRIANAPVALRRVITRTLSWRAWPRI